MKMTLPFEYPSNSDTYLELLRIILTSHLKCYNFCIIIKLSTKMHSCPIYAGYLRLLSDYNSRLHTFKFMGSARILILLLATVNYLNF